MTRQIYWRLQKQKKGTGIIDSNGCIEPLEYFIFGNNRYERRYMLIYRKVPQKKLYRFDS